LIRKVVPLKAVGARAMELSELDQSIPNLDLNHQKKYDMNGKLSKLGWIMMDLWVTI
jgi:hypothetical protein